MEIEIKLPRKKSIDLDKILKQAIDEAVMDMKNKIQAEYTGGPIARMHRGRWATVADILKEQHPEVKPATGTITTDKDGNLIIEGEAKVIE